MSEREFCGLCSSTRGQQRGFTAPSSRIGSGRLYIPVMFEIAYMRAELSAILKTLILNLDNLLSFLDKSYKGTLAGLFLSNFLAHRLIQIGSINNGRLGHSPNSW